MDTSDLDYPEPSEGDAVIVPHNHHWCTNYDVTCKDCTGMDKGYMSREWRPIYTHDVYGRPAVYVSTYGQSGCSMVEQEPIGEIKNAVSGH